MITDGTGFHNAEQLGHQKNQKLYNETLLWEKIVVTHVHGPDLLAIRLTQKLGKWVYSSTDTTITTVSFV